MPVKRRHEFAINERNRNVAVDILRTTIASVVPFDPDSSLSEGALTMIWLKMILLPADFSQYRQSVCRRHVT